MYSPKTKKDRYRWKAGNYGKFHPQRMVNNYDDDIESQSGSDRRVLPAPPPKRET